jgi:hypothetical protein
MKKRPKRKPLIPILLRLPAGLLADVDSLASEAGRPRTEQLRRMLAEWIAEKTEAV